ncbi:MAG: hypothetical protein EOP11_19315 [Proteobacteria bacterium]|nr:MAG: hypothetical protein EOP11_19315 [Pseudomonadota bacterium]
MEILGSIQSENVVVLERERMQRLMRDFIGRLRHDRRWDTENVAYRVHFSRPFFGGKVNSLIEFRAGGQEAWYARANGADPWKAFCRAMGSLKQIVMEMDLREDANAKDERPNESADGLAAD